MSNDEGHKGYANYASWRVGFDYIKHGDVEKMKPYFADTPEHEIPNRLHDYMGDLVKSDLSVARSLATALLGTYDGMSPEGIAEHFSEIDAGELDVALISYALVFLDNVDFVSVAINSILADAEADEETPTEPEGEPLFALGRIVATARVNDFFNNDVGIAYGHHILYQHQHGEWGELSEDDLQSNRDAIKYDGRIVSKYKVMSLEEVGMKEIYIITEADRSATTFLFPDEY